LNSQNDDVKNPCKDRFLPVQRKSNWIILSKVLSCSRCHEAVHGALYYHDQRMKGVKLVENAVLADSLLVIGNFMEDDVVTLWNELRNPKRMLLIGDCAVSTAERIKKFTDADIINGCPVDPEEIITILTL